MKAQWNREEHLTEKEVKTKPKAVLKDAEMKQRGCLLQGPRIAFKGLWAEFWPATCLLQAGPQSCRPRTGQQASYSQGNMLPCCSIPYINVKNMKKREGVKCFKLKHIPPD